MSQKSRRGIVCVILANMIFFQDYTEIAKKSSWHFFGGHLGPLAAQNAKLPPSDIDLGVGLRERLSLIF